jgi:hypothetical protein
MVGVMSAGLLAVGMIISMHVSPFNMSIVALENM